MVGSMPGSDVFGLKGFLMGKELKLGLKLWSVNTEMIPYAKKLYANGVFDYIELYAVPGTFDRTIAEWKSFSGPYLVHSPHNAHGFNLAQEELRQKNKEKFAEVKSFADALKSLWIVVHGGNNGSLDETIAQFIELDDERILVENKPMTGLSGELCIGFSADDIAKICRSARLSGVVLDFGHAFCAANSLGKDPMEWVKTFLGLPIKMFHIGDGDRHSVLDSHQHFGEGNLPIEEFLKCIPDESMVSVETRMDPQQQLQDCAVDFSFLRNLCQTNRVSR